MDNKIEQYQIILEPLVSIFTIDKGIIKILLMKKKNNPYKGHWILPGDLLKKDELVIDNINNTLNNKLGLKNFYLKQNYVFDSIDRDQDERVVALSYIGLIDYISATIKREQIDDVETEWFSIDAIPKMGYDHESIANQSVSRLKEILINTKVLKDLFPSDFTLPEIQRVYEQLLNKKLDRRNFRKKLLNLELITDTGYKNEGANGRPGKLYTFNDQIKEKDLF